MNTDWFQQQSRLGVVSVVLPHITLSVLSVLSIPLFSIFRGKGGE